MITIEAKQVCADLFFLRLLFLFLLVLFLLCLFLQLSLRRRLLLLLLLLLLFSLFSLPPLRTFNRSPQTCCDLVAEILHLLVTYHVVSRVMLCHVFTCHVADILNLGVLR